MPVIKTLRIVIALVFALLALLCLGMMFCAETTKISQFFIGDYANWAKAGGLLTLAISFALIAFDGEDEIVSDLTTDKN